MFCQNWQIVFLQQQFFIYGKSKGGHGIFALVITFLGFY
jgi:hypothetical protein